MNNKNEALTIKKLRKYKFSQIKWQSQKKSLYLYYKSKKGSKYANLVLILVTLYIEILWNSDDLILLTG